MEDRAIRVFVSSTFRDMQAEREELVKRVFPQVRRVCEQRGVAWSEVDLRWGVTDEQKAEGAVLPVCLAEIDRSRPFFLGLLGQRYGWVPEELPSGLVDQLPWLAPLGGTSVTELEVLHGVLNDAGSAGHAFFHLRDPGYVETRSPEEQAVLRDDVDADRLDDLKDRIRASGLPCAEFGDPAELGRQVLGELLELVDRLFPADDVPDGLERASAAHAAFGRARSAGSAPRPEVVARLDAHPGRVPLVVAGAPGSDLTAVVSSWLDTLTGPVVVRHHVGATPESSDWHDLAGRVAAALGHPVEPGAVVGRSQLFGALADPAGPAVVVVDGADLLDDVDGAPDLTWLPPAGVADGVRVVVTTTGRRPVEAALRHGWPVVEVPPLTAAERAAYTTSFLARWAKGLDAQHVQRLAGSPHTGSALYLRTVLDELRQHGDHFTIGAVLDHYLAAASLDDLLELVLARYEQDFETERAGLVGDAMRALWAARRGLTEPELLDLLDVPGAVWSPLVLAAENGLLTRSGRLGFATDDHRTAVEDRYLPTDADRARAHGVLATYFAGRELSPRTVDELPWHQLAAGDPAAAAATAADLAFLDLAYPQAPGDLRRLWARLDEAGFDVVRGYAPVVADPAAHSADRVWAVARLVTDAGHPTEAARLHRHLVDRYRGDAGDRGPARLRASLLNLGAALWTQGELGPAAEALEECAALARADGDDGVLQRAVGNLGLVRRDLGDTTAAAELLTEALDLARALDDADLLQAALGNLASVRLAEGREPEALALYDEQEQVCRSVGDAVGTGLALTGRAGVLSTLGDPTAALATYETMRVEAEARGDLTAAATAGLGEMNVLRQVGRYDEAEARGAEGEALARRLSDETLLARALDGRARIAVDLQQWPRARDLATEAVLTARSTGALRAVVLGLGPLGIAQRELGDLAGALASHTEEAELAARLSDSAAGGIALSNLAAVDIARQDLGSALSRYAAAEPLLRTYPASLVPLLANRAQIHQALSDHGAAVRDLVDCGAQYATLGLPGEQARVLTDAVTLLYQSGRAAEAEPVWVSLAEACRAGEDDAGLQRALGERALLALGRGDLATAGPLLAEQEEICRRTGDTVGLAAAVGNRAILLQQQGDLPGSLACLDEQLGLARTNGDGQGVLIATANRGEVLGKLGRRDEALAALHEARSMAASWNLTPMVQQLDQMIAALG